MVVLPPDRVYVQRDPGGESEGFEQVVDHLGGDFVVQIPDCGPDPGLYTKERACLYRKRLEGVNAGICVRREGGQCQDVSCRRVKGRKRRGLDSRSPIFSRVKGRSETKYGREEISMTALDNAYMSTIGINKRRDSLESARCTQIKDAVDSNSIAIPIESRDSPRPTGHKRCRTS